MGGQRGLCESGISTWIDLARLYADKPCSNFPLPPLPLVQDLVVRPVGDTQKLDDMVGQRLR